MLTSALFVAALLGVLASLFSLYLLHPLIDKPHVHVTPFIGGLAVFVGFWLAVMTLPRGVHYMWGVLLAAALLVWMGVIDKQDERSQGVRTFTQVAAFFVMIYFSHTSFLEISYLFLLAMFCYIHAMKKLHSLVAVIALGQAALLAILSFYSGNILLFQMLVCFSLVLLTYVLFNAWSLGHAHQRLYLGDAGGAFVVLFIVWAVLKLSQALAVIAISPMSLLWILCFPFIHTIRRDNLLKSGFALHAMLASIGFGLIGLVMARLNVSDTVQGSCFVLAVFAYRIIRSRMYWQRVNVVNERKPASIDAGYA